MKTFSAWWLSWYAAGRAENATANHAAKVMDGREKRVTTAAGEGRRQGMAAGDKSVNNRQQEWLATKRVMVARAMVTAKRVVGKQRRRQRQQRE